MDLSDIILLSPFFLILGTVPQSPQAGLNSSLWKAEREDGTSEISWHVRD